jgi:protein-S-isoprenylcysteine O-methyltransferase Ste14
MYVGLALAYVGEAGALLQAWPLLTLVAVLAYVTWWVVPIEEEGLEVFREYGDYCSRVRRWL